MDMKMKGQLALVTGASKGIGYAIAQRLLAEGARVAITGRDGNSLRKAKALLGSADRVHILQGDLSTAEGAASAVAGVEALGALDILVNNVGFFEVRNFFATDDAAWDSMFELNVMSGVRMARALLPAMLARGTGRVVFIASEQSQKPNPEMAHYAMTKAANVSIARALAELTKGTGVTVNSVLAAPTWTEGVEQFLQPVAEQQGVSVDQMRAHYFKGDGLSSLIQRFATPDEIAAVVTFLASPMSSAINGAAVRADGGIVRSLF
jgi:NAD(P)-dependent dehydrogenase (short-subunit alcohol dehydrogenase family)